MCGHGIGFDRERGMCETICRAVYRRAKALPEDHLAHREADKTFDL
jgi:hypothetical protein